MSIDGQAIESSNRYARDGHGGRDSSWWEEILGMLKFISFQLYLYMF